MFLTEYDEDLHLKNTYEEGKMAGKAMGRTMGRAEMIVRILESKGEVSTEIRKKILSIADMDTQNTIFEYAMKAETVEEFEQKFFGGGGGV